MYIIILVVPDLSAMDISYTNTACDVSGGNTMQTSLLQIKDIIVSESSGKVALARVFWAVFPGDVKPHKAPHLQSAGFMLTFSPKNTGMLVTIPKPVEDMQQQPVLLKFQGCLLATLEDPG